MKEYPYKRFRLECKIRSLRAFEPIGHWDLEEVKFTGFPDIRKSSAEFFDGEAEQSDAITTHTIESRTVGFTPARGETLDKQLIARQVGRFKIKVAVFSEGFKVKSSGFSYKNYLYGYRATFFEKKGGQFLPISAAEGTLSLNPMEIEGLPKLSATLSLKSFVELAGQIRELHASLICVQPAVHDGGGAHHCVESSVHILTTNNALSYRWGFNNPLTK